MNTMTWHVCDVLYVLYVLYIQITFEDENHICIPLHMDTCMCICIYKEVYRIDGWIDGREHEQVSSRIPDYCNERG